MGFVNIGPLELLLIGIIALLVLGPQRLPEAARSVGRGMREMKDAISGIGDDEDDDQDDDEHQPQVDYGDEVDDELDDDPDVGEPDRTPTRPALDS